MLGNFEFRVCVLARHPDADVSELGTLLGRIPIHCSMVGMPVKTPTGTCPGGVYRDSRCLVGMASNEDGGLADCFAATVAELEPLKDFIGQLRSKGGEVEIFVRWYPNGNTGETLPAELLGRMASLGVSLGFNIYGVDPSGNASA